MPADPDATFAALHRAADALCGVRLFTVTLVDRAAGLARRAYTSHPEAYPVSGTKPIAPNAWTATVLDAARPFVANSTDAFRDHFPDHATINALGCEAALNLPVAEGGTVVGTVNLLDAAGHFTPERVVALTDLVARHREDLAAAMAALAREPAR